MNSDSYRWKDYVNSLESEKKEVPVTPGKYQQVDLRAAGVPLHDAEPWFLIRGQDLMAVPAIEDYAHQLEASTGFGNPMVAEIRQIAFEIQVWQDQNPDKVKMPD